MTLEQIKEQLENDYPPMRLKGFYKKWIKKVPLNEFIIEFLKEHSLNFPTINTNNKTIICANLKRRSLGDIYMICKYYYPKCTLEEVIKVLFSLVGEVTGFRYTWCSQTERKMFYYAENRNTEIQKYQRDEFDNIPNFYQNI